jgi:L-aspartate oxidase
VEWGARFDREPSGDLAFGREGAHRLRRVLHAADATGREIGRTLWARVAQHSSVRVERHAMATSLIVEAGRCVGARYSTPQGAGTVHAGAVLLATGGAGQVFRETTNPSIATGDGVMLGWFAGARVMDMEFVQFHPTALDVPGAPRFLLSEALRGEGARLINSDGERFMTRYHDAGELASRDIVARAMVAERARTGAPVFLSMQHLDADWVRARFPTITEACRSAGLDLATDRIPAGPAAHYIMGGVQTDVWGRTTVPGLFAAGEVACTGVHGANRLASNSLLEGLVFGARAARAMRERTVPEVPEVPQVPPAPRAGFSKVPDSRDVQSLMWQHVGLARDRDGLETAIGKLDAWYASIAKDARSQVDAERAELVSLVTVARLIARAALRREESRGGHYRADFPQRDDVKFRIHLGDEIH